MQVIMVNKVNHTLHKLGATAVVFRAIVEIDHEVVDVAKTLTNRFPPLGEAVGEAVAGDFGQDAVEKDFIQGRHQDAHRCQSRLGFEIVIARLGLDAAFAPTGKGTDFDGGFGIDGNP